MDDLTNKILEYCRDISVPIDFKYRDYVNSFDDKMRRSLKALNSLQNKLTSSKSSYTSNEASVETIIQECKSMGITNFVTSIMQSYGYLEGTSKDRGVIQALRNIGYDWDANYNKTKEGKLAHVAKLSVGQQWGTFFKSMIDKYGVTIKSCSSNNMGL